VAPARVGARMARRSRTFTLTISSDDPTVAYLELPTHPVGRVRVSRSVRLYDLIGRYAGPEVLLDFDAEGVLVGIEVV